MKKYFNLVILTFLFVNPAYSQSKGLPQLDFTTYPSLIFWSVISLLSLYLIMSLIITPKISTVINDREQHLQNDLIKAKAFKQEADDTLNKINIQLDKTKIDAKSIIEKAVSDSNISSEKTLKDLNIKLNDKIDKSIRDIEKDKNKILKDVFNEAYELSNLIVSKTSGLKADKNKLKNILKQETKTI